MDKPLIVVSYPLEDHEIAFAVAGVLRAHGSPAFDFALSALGTLVFPQRSVAGRDPRASGEIALQILVWSESAIESHWLAVVAGFSMAKEIPTVVVRLRDRGVDLPKSLHWLDAVELDSPQGWQIFCEKCCLKCRGFPRFQPSQEEHSRILQFEPPEASATIRALPERLLATLDQFVIRFRCWGDEDKKFTSLCDAEGVRYQRGGADASSTPLDVIGDDFVLYLRREYLDDLSGPQFRVGGYDEPGLRWQRPRTRVYKTEARFSINPEGFYRAAALVDLWRAQLRPWRTVKVSVHRYDGWGVDRVRLREVSEGRFPSELVADMDEGLLVCGVAIRLGSPRLLKQHDLRFQTLEFKRHGLVSRCEVGSALDSLVQLGIVRQLG